LDWFPAASTGGFYTFCSYLWSLMLFLIFIGTTGWIILEFDGGRVGWVNIRTWDAGLLYSTTV